jgi:hypothetical protein
MYRYLVFATSASQNWFMLEKGTVLLPALKSELWLKPRKGLRGFVSDRFWRSTGRWASECENWAEEAVGSHEVGPSRNRAGLLTTATAEQETNSI